LPEKEEPLSRERVTRVDQLEKVKDVVSSARKNARGGKKRSLAKGRNGLDSSLAEKKGPPAHHAKERLPSRQRKKGFSLIARKGGSQQKIR